MIELDRLADFACGLLDGTPEGEEVARLVATDPAWTQAYGDLVAADRLVLTDLRSLGAAAEPIPADVAARLDPRRGNVVPLDAARRKRTRRWRVAAVAAVAAGVVAFGAYGVQTLLPDRGGSAGVQGISDGGAATSRDDKAAAPPAAAPEVAGKTMALQNAAVVVFATGRDYRRDSLGTAANLTRGQDSLPRFNGAGPAVYTLDPVPEELVPLVDPFARQACLATVTRSYGGRAASVDYARFEGAPALVIRLTGPDRTVIVGPSCGVRGGGTDERYATPPR